MRCWKCGRAPSEQSPFVVLRVNEFRQQYSCVPCVFDLGNQESQRRAHEELDLKDTTG